MICKIPRIDSTLQTSFSIKSQLGAEEFMGEKAKQILSKGGLSIQQSA